MDLSFSCIHPDVDETEPDGMPVEEVPCYLAKKKADVIDFSQFAPDTIVIACDTIVVLDGKIIGKPENEIHAKETLRQLSGKKHTVISGGCLKSEQKSVCFSDCTDVYFRELTTGEIEHYVRKYKPFDKAGGYGTQEWIGLVGIERIEGSYFNVMGLPTEKLYKALIGF